MSRAGRINRFPAGQEMLVHRPDHVKAVSHDLRTGKMLARQREVARSQIHADELHLLLTFESLQIIFQRRLAAPRHDVIDLVVLQIAEGGRITAATRETVLVYAQNLRTLACNPLSGKKLQIPDKPALDGSARQSLPLTQPAAADAVKMLLAHSPPERLGGPHARLNTRKALPESAAAFAAMPFARLQLDPAVPCSPTLVP